MQLSSLGIVDVQVGSNVCILIVRYSVVELVVGRVLLVKLVVARSDDVYLLMLEDIKGVVPFRV